MNSYKTDEDGRFFINLGVIKQIKSEYNAEILDASNDTILIASGENKFCLNWDLSLQGIYGTVFRFENGKFTFRHNVVGELKGEAMEYLSEQMINFLKEKRQTNAEFITGDITEFFMPRSPGITGIFVAVSNNKKVHQWEYFQNLNKLITIHNNGAHFDQEHHCFYYNFETHIVAFRGLDECSGITKTLYIGPKFYTLNAILV